MDDLIKAAERMCAHYETVFRGMSPDATQFSTGYSLTLALRAALDAIKPGDAP